MLLGQQAREVYNLAMESESGQQLAASISALFAQYLTTGQSIMQEIMEAAKKSKERQKKSRNHGFDGNRSRNGRDRDDRDHGGSNGSQEDLERRQARELGGGRKDL